MICRMVDDILVAFVDLDVVELVVDLVDLVEGIRSILFKLTAKDVRFSSAQLDNNNMICRI